MSDETIIMPEDDEEMRIPPSGIYKIIPLDQIIVDREHYQRPLKPHWVKWIANNFNPRWLGLMTVSQAGPELYKCINGQHRIEAMKMIGFTHARFEVQPTTLVKEEAEAFIHLNSGLDHSAVGLFKAEIEAEDPTALAILEILTRTGWKPQLGHHPVSPGETVAIQALKQLYRRSPEWLEAVLQLTRDTWPEDTAAGTAFIFRAVNSFLHNAQQSGVTINTRRFIQANRVMLLRSNITRARNDAALELGSPEVVMARIFAKNYNHKLPSGSRVRFVHDDD